MNNKYYMIACIALAIAENNYGVGRNSDGCFIIGAPCVCANSGSKGSCVPDSSSARRELYCKCQADTAVNSGQNRDGCTVMADPCVCANTGGRGFCFPGSRSINGELYCSCQADTYSPHEAVYEWIKRYVMLPDNLRDNINKKYTLDKFGLGLLNSKTAVDLGRRNTVWLFDQFNTGSANSVKVYDQFLNNAAKEPIFGEIFRLSDGCMTIDQPCVCGNTLMRGVCGINYPKNGQAFQKDEMYCHCD